MGFHPLVAFDGLTGDCLKAQLRPGNVYTSNGVVDFVQPLLAHYNQHFPGMIPFVRADSGFAVPGLYELCEKLFVWYVIALKSNAVLKRLAEEYHPSTPPKDFTKTEVLISETIYQAKSWNKERRIVIRSVRPAGELFFHHSFYVTNLGDTFTPSAIVQTYQKRGTMENFIKEAKYGFELDRMNSHSYQVNEAKMMMSVLAYNFINWLRTLTFPTGQQNLQMTTIRMKLVKVASKLVKSGRYLYFKLSESFVYSAFFWEVLTNIQGIQLE